MLTEEGVKEIREKLIEHINSTFSDDTKQSAIDQVLAMDNEELESFLEKNNLIKDNSPSECVFCSIVNGSIKSCKIDENKKAIAVLDINSISKGHSLIISKSHSEEDEKEVEVLTKSVSEKIKEKFSPKKIEISKSKLFGHKVVTVLPIYFDETINSNKKHCSLEELEKIKEELEKKEIKEEIEEPKSKIEKIKEFLWLPKRIP